MATSAATVFGTMELLEMILLGCTMEEITCARRINTFVQATIDGSKRLRQKVFLEAAPGGEKLVIPDWRHRSTEVPLVVPSGDLTVRNGTYNTEIVRVNPLLEQLARTATAPASVPLRGPRNLAIVQQNFLDRMSGPWEEMMITQPPVPSLNFTVVKTRGRRSNIESTSQTLGELRAELLALDRGRTLRPRPAGSPAANRISYVSIFSRRVVHEWDPRVAKGRVNFARMAAEHPQRAG